VGVVVLGVIALALTSGGGSSGPVDSGPGVVDAPPEQLPPPPPPVVMDGPPLPGNAGRQQELLAQARAEKDPLKAVGILSKIISIDAKSAFASTALLERAKRYEAAGDGQAAEKDLRRVLAESASGDDKAAADEALRRITSTRGN
jgi:hypothetical protein